MGALGYQRCLLSKPIVGQNRALHAAPADTASNCMDLVSAFLTNSASFSPTNFSNPQQSTVSQRVNQNLTCGSNSLHFVSPRYVRPFAVDWAQSIKCTISIYPTLVRYLISVIPHPLQHYPHWLAVPCLKKQLPIIYVKHKALPRSWRKPCSTAGCQMTTTTTTTKQNNNNNINNTKLMKAEEKAPHSRCTQTMLPPSSLTPNKAKTRPEGVCVSTIPTATSRMPSQQGVSLLGKHARCKRD